MVRINCFVFLLHQTYTSLTYISTNLFIKFDIVPQRYRDNLSDMLLLETSKLYI